MASFLSLPNEVKIQIIESTAPDDIENLALCCNLVYRLAEKTLKQHKADKKCFYKVMRLSEDRCLRLYPKDVTLLEYRDQVEEPEMIENTRATDEDRSLRDSLLKDLDSPYMDQNEMKALINRTVDGKPGAANCLVLTLLPNVERMGILDWNDNISDLSDMLVTISKTNDNASSLTAEKLSLLKLREVDISDFDGYNPNQSGMLEAFMSLPSIQVVRMQGLIKEQKFDKLISPDQRSNVTELHFRSCALAVSQLKCLLERLVSLQTFSYEYSAIHYNIGDEEFIARISTLYCCAGKTLTFLSCISKRKDTPRDHLVQYANTLSKFEVLKTLRVSRAAFIHNGVTRQLVKELPSSLEELELVGTITTEEAEPMFHGMLATKQERLPKLRLIVFEGAVPFGDEAIAAYETVGLVMDWRDMDTRMIQRTGKRWLGGVEL